MTDPDRETPARRDWQGRYPTGRSGNPAGRPRGALNRATRIAAELLDGEAEALWRAEIDLALAGDRVLLRHCNDRIIAPQRAQPVAFAMPRIEDAADLAAAMGALLGAAARGLITPAEAESLARSCEASARTIEIGERIGRQRLAAEQQAVERRFALRAAALLFSGVREMDEEAGGIDYRLRELSKPILRIGEAALAALAAIPDTPELVEADRGFLAAHPPRLDREASPLGAAIGRAWLKLEEYLGPATLRRLDREIAERQEAGEAAPPRYRTGLFERLCGSPAPPQATAGDESLAALQGGKGGPLAEGVGG
jgi:hypothetical protein